MSLTKLDIVEKVYRDMGASRKEATQWVELVFQIIKDTLAKGEKVKISGFGNFSIKDKAARNGRNPQSGEPMKILARRVLNFKTSQVLKDDIMSRYAHRINSKGEEDRSISPKEGSRRALNSFINNVEDI